MNPSFANAKAISASYVQVMADLVESHGGDSNALIRKAALGRHRDADPLSFITLGQYDALLREALAVTKNPALGLFLGKAIKFSDHGTFAYSALSFPRLWDAMKVGMKFSKLVNQVVDIQLEEKTKFNIIKIDTAYFSGDIYHTVLEMVMSLFCEILRFMLNEEISDIEIDFCFSAPEYESEYHDVFESKLKFNAPTNEVRIPKALANKPLIMANPDVARKFEQECDKLIEKIYQPKSYHQLVHEALYLCRGSFPQLDDVAEQLNTSPRTMRRRLQEEGTSFKQVLDEVRLDLASRYLAMTELSIGEIAELLGYTDQNSFSHAYKQLTGYPPTTYRKQLDSA
ncbi:MAG: AraC family transcriptional regulator [Pseudomonadales bacterium]|nr:AraC family transcriptional regulator [Pseudomonadales bacterium]